jgi:hypothetical protein
VEISLLVGFFQARFWGVLAFISRTVRDKIADASRDPYFSERQAIHSSSASPPHFLAPRGSRHVVSPQSFQIPILGQVAEWFKALDSKSQGSHFQQFALVFGVLQVADFEGHLLCRLILHLSQFCPIFGPKCINVVYKISAK